MEDCCRIYLFCLCDVQRIIFKFQNKWRQCELGSVRLLLLLTVETWILGLFLCKAAIYFQGVSVCASVNTLVAIAMDRFLAICHPMKHQITTCGCRIIITLIWIFSFFLIIPWAIFFKLVPMGFAEDTILNVCEEKWPTKKMGDMYFLIANLMLCYLLPLTIILACYVLIWLRVWKRKMPGENQGKSVENIIHKSKIKVIKMLTVVVVIFMFSWLPLYIIFAKIKFGDSTEDDNFELAVAAPIAQWLGVSNSCINPILYAFFNGKFRACFKKILFGSKQATSTKQSKEINDKLMPKSRIDDL